MNFEQTWRWFGSYDTIPLTNIRQTGATGIVTALHHIPAGETWPVEEIEKRKQVIEDAGLRWSVVESIPVHEDIKKQSGNYKNYIENYKQSIRNLAECGIFTVCYNFMPLTDWTRTSVNHPLKNEGTTLRFDAISFAAFELFILERESAKNEYPDEIQQEASRYYDTLSADEISQLTKVILLGLPGEEEVTLSKFRDRLKEYNNINGRKLRQNLYYFLEQIIPVAEKCNVRMAIHPDDPPFPLFGLPRIVSTSSDVRQLLSAVDSPYNGLTFCTGSYGAHPKNNLADMVKQFGERINFIHLRNIKRETDNSFQETYHLEGDVDLHQVMVELIKEQHRRKAAGRNDLRMPIRPDHGPRILDDLHKESYPGYSGLGRLKGLAELRGLELGIRQMLK